MPGKPFVENHAIFDDAKQGSEVARLPRANRAHNVTHRPFDVSKKGAQS